MLMLPCPVLIPCSPSCPKSCSLKRYDVTLRSSRRNKPGGSPASATRKSGKPWPYCIASRPILGRLPDSQTRSEFRVPYWPSVSGVTYLKPPLLTLHAGGFSSARKCLHRRALVLRRSLQRWAMSRSRPLTAPSNVSSAFRRPDFAANQDQPEAESSATHRRTVTVVRSGEQASEDTLSSRI